MRHSQSKKFSSLIGPATIPSGGFRVSSKKMTKILAIGKKTKGNFICHNHDRKIKSDVQTNNVFIRLYSAIKRRNADPAIVTATHRINKSHTGNGSLKFCCFKLIHKLNSTTPVNEYMEIPKFS